MPETVRVYWDRGGVSMPRRRAETHKGRLRKAPHRRRKRRVYRRAESLRALGGALGRGARISRRAGSDLERMRRENDEAMPFPLPCDASGKLTADALAPLREYYDRCGVLALGPVLAGAMGRRLSPPRSSESFRKDRPRCGRALGGILVPDILREAKSEIVITPHEGSFSVSAARWKNRARARRVGVCAAVRLHHGTQEPPHDHRAPRREDVRH